MSLELTPSKLASGFDNGDLLKSRYRSLGKINRGSYGEVYLAEDIFTKERLAVKYIFPMNDTNDTCAEAEKEISIYLTLGKHPNVASLVDYFGSFLILDYCEKGDLYDLIKMGQGPSTKKEIMDIMIQMIDLTAYFHNKGVYHRDIKPENIFMTGDNQIKLGDWGLATTERYCDDYDVGSDRYMAPELFDTLSEFESLEEINDRYDASKIDIWSLGICFLNIIFGKNPFSIANANDKMFLNFCNNREILFDIFPSMSTDLFNVLRHCLTINPDNRDLNLMKRELIKLDVLTYDEYDSEEDEEVSEISSFTTKDIKPISISQSYQNHKERKPLSIQTPQVHGALNSKTDYNRKDLYTPPSKRFLDKNYRNNKNTHNQISPRKSNLAFEGKPQRPNSFHGKKPLKLSMTLDIKAASSTNAIYIPPNLRNRLKSPAFQAKTVTAEVCHDTSSSSFSKPEHFEAQQTDDIYFDDLDDILANNFKEIKLNDDINRNSSNSSSNGVSTQSLESQSSNNTLLASAKVYVPPHHRPDYSGKSKARSKLKHNIGLQPKKSDSRNIPLSNSYRENNLTATDSSSTLSKSMPPQRDFKKSWADYEDNENEPILFDNFTKLDLLLNDYTSGVKKIPSAINVQM